MEECLYIYIYTDIKIYLIFDTTTKSPSVRRGTYALLFPYIFPDDLYIYIHIEGTIPYAEGKRLDTDTHRRYVSKLYT